MWPGGFKQLCAQLHIFCTPQFKIQTTHAGLKDIILQLTQYPQITEITKGYRKAKQQAMKNYRKEACLGHKECKAQLPSTLPLLFLNLFSVLGVFFCFLNEQPREIPCENTAFPGVWGFQLLECICMNACIDTTVCVGSACRYCGGSDYTFCGLVNVCVQSHVPCFHYQDRHMHLYWGKYLSLIYQSVAQCKSSSGSRRMQIPPASLPCPLFPSCHSNDNYLCCGHLLENSNIIIIFQVAGIEVGVKDFNEYK